MSFLQRLFRLSEPEYVSPEPGMRFIIKNSNVLHIKKARWIAPGQYSANRHFFVAGKQSDIVLVHTQTNTILFVHTSYNQINPYTLFVSNSGLVLVEDNCDEDERLSSDFYVLSCTGNVLLSRTIGANIYNTIIDESETLALFHTTASAQPQYDHFLYIFDIASGQLIQRWQPPHGPPHSYLITEKNRIVLCYETGQGKNKYTYTLNGQLLSEGGHAIR